MNNALLMGMPHGLTDRDEQFKTLVGGQLVLIAIVGERNAVDELKLRLPLVRTMVTETYLFRVFLSMGLLIRSRVPTRLSKGRG